MAVEPICTCVVGVVVVLAAVLWLICLLIVCLWLFITHLRAFLMSARSRDSNEPTRRDWRMAEDDAPKQMTRRLPAVLQSKTKERKRKRKRKKKAIKMHFLMFVIREANEKREARGGEKKRDLVWACRRRWGALNENKISFLTHIINPSIEHDHCHACLLESTAYYCLLSTPTALNLTLRVGWVLTWSSLSFIPLLSFFIVRIVY